MPARVGVQIDSESAGLQRDLTKVQAKLISATEKIKELQRAGKTMGDEHVKALNKGTVAAQTFQQKVSHTQQVLLDMGKVQWAMPMFGAQDKLIKGQEQLAAGAQRYGQATRAGMNAGMDATTAAGLGMKSSISNVEKHHKTSMGNIVHQARVGVGDLVRVWAGFGVAGVVGKGITQLFQDVQAELERFAELGKTQEQWDAQFAQLAGGDPKKFAALIQNRMDFQAMGGAPPGPQGGPESTKAIFNLESIGVNTPANIKLAADLYGIIEGNTGETLAQAVSFSKTMGGEGATGTLKQLLSKAVISSRPSPQTIGLLLKTAADTAASASLLGLDDEEVLAMIGAMAPLAGGTTAAGEDLKMLFTALSKQGMLEGKTRSEIIPTLKSFDLTPEQYGGILGPDVTNALYNWANNMRQNKKLGMTTTELTTLRGANIKEILTGITERGWTETELDQALTPELVDMLQEAVGQFGESFRGQPLADIIERIQAMNLRPPQLMEIFGRRQQALSGFHFAGLVLPEGTKDGYRQLLEQNYAANEDANDEVDKMIKSKELQPTIQASTIARTAAGRVDIAGMGFGAEQQLVKGAMDRKYKEDLDKGNLGAGVLRQKYEKQAATYLGRVALMETIGTTAELEQYVQTLAAMAPGGDRLLRPELTPALTKGLEEARERDKKRAASGGMIFIGGQMYPKETPGIIGPGRHEYLQAAEKGFGGVEKLLAPTGPVSVKDEEGTSWLKKIADIQQGAKNAPASVIPGMGTVEKGMGAGVRWIGKEIAVGWKELWKPRDYWNPSSTSPATGEGITNKLIDVFSTDQGRWVMVADLLRNNIVPLIMKGWRSGLYMSGSMSPPIPLSNIDDDLRRYRESKMGPTTGGVDWPDAPPSISTKVGLGATIDKGIALSVLRFIGINPITPPTSSTHGINWSGDPNSYIRPKSPISEADVASFSEYLNASNPFAGLEGMPPMGAEGPMWEPRHSANFGHSAGRYAMSRPERDPNVAYDHFGRPKFLADREENNFVETRSDQFRGKAETGYAGLRGGVINVKDEEGTPLLQRAVKALEQLVAASSGPTPPAPHYPGGFKRGTSSSRSPSPILRER